MDANIRKPLIQELPSLRKVWETVFASADGAIFFDYYFDSNLSLVAAQDDVLATGYLLPAGNLIYGENCENTIPCAMIYAIATLPEYRRRGYAAAIVQNLITAGRAAGYPAIVLCPSEDSLFKYYSANTELFDFFFTNEQRYKKIPPESGKTHISKISADEYCKHRRALLKDTPHIDLERRAIEYQRLLCDLFGGGLYRIDSPHGASYAVVEKQAGSTLIKELLTPDGGEADALSAVAAKFPASEYIVRTPAQNHPHINNAKQNPNESSIRRFGMLATPLAGLYCSTPTQNNVPGNCVPKNYTPWYGLAFD